MRYYLKAMPIRVYAHPPTIPITETIPFSAISHRDVANADNAGAFICPWPSGYKHIHKPSRYY
jgi:hypothetical protein